jgi:hypothetical protein
MFKKIIGFASAGVASAVLPLLANAQYTANPFVVPSSTAQSFLAQVSSQLTDSGTLTIAVVGVAIPLTFYLIHQLMSLVPKSRGRRRD